MRSTQEVTFASSLKRSTVSRDKSTNRIRVLAMVCLAIVLGTNALPARAQDKPIAFGSDTDLSAANKSEYLRVAGLYKNETDAAKRKALRNQLISLTIAQTDLNFLSYQKKTRHRRAILSTLMDFLEIGTSTAISIMNGERARTVTSELLGLLQLTRQSVNKNFSLKETQILFNKMVAKRAEIQASIIQKMTSQEDDQYWFALAMIDLIAYYRAGTMDGAMENLNIDTGHEAEVALEALDNIKLSPPATKEDAALAKSANDVLFDLLGQLQDSDPDTRKAASDKLIAIVTELEKNKDLVPFLKAAGISSQDTDGKKLRLGLVNVSRALRSLVPPRFDLLNKLETAIVQ